MPNDEVIAFSEILGIIYLLMVVLRFDAVAIIYLPLAIGLRLIQLPNKVLNKIYKADLH